MYRYLLLLLHLRIIAATVETKSEETKIDSVEETTIQKHTPLILADHLGSYHYPKRGTLTETDQQQKYYHSKYNDGRYYCPIENTEKNKDLLEQIKEIKKVEYEYCLFEKKFKKEEDEFCEDEVKPVIVEKRDKMGQERCGTGYMYKFAYEICVEKSIIKKFLRKIKGKKNTKGNIFADVQHPHLYEICHNHHNEEEYNTSNRTLFTHHKIRHPYIFRNLHVIKENNMHDFSKINPTETYGLKNLIRLETNLETAERQKKSPSEDSDTETTHSEDSGSEKPALKNLPSRNQRQNYEYLFRKLVPPVDFALGHWKKTTFHLINCGLMHTSKMAWWDYIDGYVNYQLIEKYNELGEVDIFTGTYGELADQYNNKKYLMDDKEAGVTIPILWWKLLYSKSKKKAVVLIMHNIEGLRRVCVKENDACQNQRGPFYCCNILSALEHITTIQYLKLGNLKELDILKLDLK